MLIWLNDQWYTYIQLEYVSRVTLIIIQNYHVTDFLVSSRAFYNFSRVSFVILCLSKCHKHSRCFADLLQRQQCAKMRWYSDNACTCLSVKLIYKNHSFDRKEKRKDFSSLPSSTSALPRPKKEMKNVTRRKKKKQQQEKKNTKTKLSMLYIFARSINKKKKIPFLRRLFDASVLKEQKKDNYLCMVSRIVYRRVKNKKRKERNKERREVRIRCWRDEEDIIITVIITIIRNTPATPHFRFHL